MCSFYEKFEKLFNLLATPVELWDLDVGICVLSIFFSFPVVGYLLGGGGEFEGGYGSLMLAVCCKVVRRVLSLWIGNSCPHLHPPTSPPSLPQPFTIISLLIIFLLPPHRHPSLTPSQSPPTPPTNTLLPPSLFLPLSHISGPLSRQHPYHASAFPANFPFFVPRHSKKREGGK